MRIYIISTLLILPFIVNAQNHYINRKYSETAINVTGILQTLPVFNQNVQFPASEATLLFKWPLKPSKPRALRIGLGALVNPDVEGASNLFLSLGTERTRHVFGDFYVFSGIDLHFIAEDSNRSGAWGTGILFGMKYDLHERLSIYTEARFNIDFQFDDGVVFEIRPPTSIYVSYRFYKN